MLRGSRAVVTGGTRGMGFAIARALREAGAQVVITGRNAERLERAVRELGDGAYPLVWDAARYEESQAHLAQAAERMGGLDILVNNAGILPRTEEWNPKTALELDAADWRTVMDVNVSSTYFAMQAAVRYYLQNGIRGNVLNISSTAGLDPAYGPYGASKAAVYGLTRGWGMLYAGTGVVINGIAPGPVATEMNGWRPGDPLTNPHVPGGRYITPEEIAALAIHLLSTNGEMMLGETVVLDGGYTMRHP